MSEQAGYPPRLSHADLNLALREHKALAIEARLRSVTKDLTTVKMLDVGTGSGTIAAHFSNRVGSLVSVDVVDERINCDFPFQLIQSEVLPFKTGSFDVVISNHVIEHTNDQRLHLQEINRVLRSGGVCYLAAPNRFALIEPHFRLPLLSWLPACLRDAYVRLAYRGRHYDVQPVTYSFLRALAAQCGFEPHDVSEAAARMCLPKPAHPLAKVMKPVFPSYIFLLRKPYQWSDAPSKESA